MFVGGEHQDRGVVARRTQPPADLQPVEVGEAEIQDDGVLPARATANERSPRRPIGHGFDVVALEAQGVFKRPAHARVVVDHQDAHDHRTYRRAFAPARAIGVSSLKAALASVRGSSIGRTSAFGAGCWRFEPSPRSKPDLLMQQ